MARILSEDQPCEYQNTCTDMPHSEVILGKTKNNYYFQKFCSSDSGTPLFSQIKPVFQCAGILPEVLKRTEILLEFAEQLGHRHSKPSGDDLQR
jgi:hypothetical protein